MRILFIQPENCINMEQTVCLKCCRKDLSIDYFNNENAIPACNHAAVSIVHSSATNKKRNIFQSKKFTFWWIDSSDTKRCAHVQWYQRVTTALPYTPRSGQCKHSCLTPSVFTLSFVWGHQFTFPISFTVSPGRMSKMLKNVVQEQ